MLQWTIDGIPLSINRTYAVRAVKVKGKYIGQMYKTQAARDYEHYLGLQVRLAHAQSNWQIPPKNVALELVITITPKDLRADVDGGVKINMDTVSKALDFNDRQIRRVIVEALEPDKLNPHTHFILRELQR